MSKNTLALVFSLVPFCSALRQTNTHIHRFRFGPRQNHYSTFQSPLLRTYNTMSATKGDGCGGMGIHQPAKSEHKYTLVWMHGLGDTAQGWEDIVTQFSALGNKFSHMKFILPTAEVRPVSLNSGLPMPAWFDIKSLDVGGEEDTEGMIHAVKRVRNIIQLEEDAGIKPADIFIGGFSQGGALAYLTALMTTQRYGGVIGCSAWLPLIAHKQEGHNPHTNKIPVLHCHGTDDPMVQFEYGKASAEFLKSDLKMQVEFKSYEGMSHSACPEELTDIAAFLISKMS